MRLFIPENSGWLAETNHWKVVCEPADVTGATQFPGDSSGEALPDPIPNSVVKLSSADDTATGGKKPATLTTGLVVQVPLFVNIGDKIKVDTRTHEYMSRA